jgi:hypothetical protein
MRLALLQPVVDGVDGSLAAAWAAATAERA